MQPERPISQASCGASYGHIMLVVPFAGGRIRYELTEHQALMLRSELALAIQEAKHTENDNGTKHPKS